MYRTMVAVVLLALSSRARADASGDLNRFFDAEWKWDLADAPESATLYGDRTHDDRLSDLSAAHLAARKAHLRERLARAKSFSSKRLGEQDRLSLELFIRTTQDDIDHARFPVERLAISQQAGPHLDLAVLATVPAYRTRKELTDYVKRLHAMPRYIDQTIALLDEGVRTGWTEAREPVRDLPADIRALVTKRPEDSVLYHPFVTTSVPEAERRAVTAEAAQTIAHEVSPAFEKLASYVEKTYLPATRKDVGVWALPEGAALYAECIHRHTTTTRTAEEIHALGLAEVARLDAEMAVVMRATGWTGSRDEFARMLRTDPRFFYKDGASLLIGSRDIAKRIDGALPSLFRTLPRLPYGVEATPANEEKTATTAYYRPGSPSDARSGTYTVNLYEPETRPKWEMEALTLHEAVPGHHLQIALAQELTDLPRFRRELSFTAYTEGWGLYAESLGAALGMFKDPYSRYGQLTYEMWRAVRLVVDTGIHAKRWTRQQAIDYFMSHAAKTRHDVEVEVDRYIVWPGQALAYKIGELELKRLRARSEAQLGERFDVRAFHDAVLLAGALPLDLVARRVEAWVANEKRR